MTREVAIKGLKAFRKEFSGYEPNEEMFDMAIKALEQEPIFNIMALLEKTYNDFCSCEGGEGWLKIDGKEYSTDTGYAIEGVDIFMEVFKRRLAELTLVTPQKPRWIPVSERLPEPDIEVLVTDDAGGLATLSTDFIYENEVTSEKEWYASQNVTAWMPLPKPYKAESEDT